MREDPFFEVTEGPLMRQWGTARFFHDKPTEEVKGWKGIFRGSPGRSEPLSIVSSTYKLVPNSEIFPRVEEALEEVRPGGWSVDYRTAFRGAKTWGHFRIDSETQELDRLSSLTPSISVRNAYDGSSGIGAYAKSIDNFCTNGLVFARDVSLFYHRHTKGFESEKFAVRLDIENVLANFAMQVEQIRKWKEQEVRPEEAKEMLSMLNMSARAEENMHSLFMREAEQRGLSYWALVSAMTQWASHGDVRQTGKDSGEAVRENRHGQVLVWIQRLGGAGGAERAA